MEGPEGLKGTRGTERLEETVFCPCRLLGFMLTGRVAGPRLQVILERKLRGLRREGSVM